MTDFRQYTAPQGPEPQDRRRLLPPRTLPLVYFAAARAAFLVALLAVALEPEPLAASFYHAHALGIVHLVTLGWITASIFGSLYIVGPFALRIALPAGWADAVCCALAVAGTTGVAAGLWLNTPSRAGWSGLLLMPAALLLAVRTVRALARAPVQPAVTWHVALAFANFVLAASLGVAIAFDRGFLLPPSGALPRLYAHAHLAALGWAAMMVMGIGYRLFPMVLPAAMPRGPLLLASAFLMQGGLLLLLVGLLGSITAATAAGALLVVAAFAAFFAQVRRMLASPRPAPAARPWPDYGVWQSMAALVFLGASIALGIYLVAAPPSEWTLRLAATYGVVGLVGFFGQLIAGMEYRLLPYHAWYWAFANTGFKGEARSPHALPVPGLQRAAFFLWIPGVILVAVGVLLARPGALAAGAWTLVAGVTIGTVDAALIAAEAYRRPR